MDLSLSTYSKTIVKWFLGAFLIAVLAQIRIPIGPVPITLQTVGVLLLGFLFSPRDAVSSVLLYIMIGLCGLPVFSGFSGGLSVLSGSTVGYLFGFLPAAYVVSCLAHRCTNMAVRMMAALIGTVIMCGCGVYWLSLSIGFEKAVQIGLMPFILPGIAKAGVLVVLLRLVGRS